MNQHTLQLDWKSIKIIAFRPFPPIFPSFHQWSCIFIHLQLIFIHAYSNSSPHQELPPSYYRVGGLDETSIVRSGFLKDMDLTLRSGMTRRCLSVTSFLPGRKMVAPKYLYQFFFGEEELEAEKLKVVNCGQEKHGWVLCNYLKKNEKIW